MQYFSSLFWLRTLHISEDLLSIIRSLNTVYTTIGICRAELLKVGKINTINLLTSIVNYSGRTAPLTSKVAFYIFIQQI